MKIPELETELHKLNIQGTSLGKLVCDEKTFDDFISFDEGISKRMGCLIWKVGDCLIEICVADYVANLKYGEVLLENLSDSFERKTVLISQFA